MCGKLIRTIIAENNLDSRNYLKAILCKNQDFKIIGEAEQGDHLIELIAELKPAVAFVDIDLPVIDGMAAIKQIREKYPDLIIIFITSSAERAHEAFEVSAMDFIVKPYTVERVEKSLIKLRAFLATMENKTKKIQEVLLSGEKLYIKSGHEIIFIDIDQIYFIEKEHKKTKIHTLVRKYETMESMNTIERRLDQKRFIRSHKCYIINLSRVEKIQPWGSDSYLVKFCDYKNDALISRSKVKILLDLLGVVR